VAAVVVAVVAAVVVVADVENPLYREKWMGDEYTE